MKRKIFITVAIVLLATTVSLFAQGANEESSKENVEITFATFSASGGNEDTLDKMYEEFKKVHPEITVNIEVIGYNDYFTAMQTRVAGGTAPDCYELNIENFAAYSSKNVLNEITDVDLSNVNETALQAFNVKGKQYGLPGSFSNVLLFYNEDLFDKAGVSYPTSEWTWYDALEAAIAIRDLDENTFGLMAPVTYNEFFKVVKQYGGALLNEDKTQFTIDTPENLMAAQMMIDKVNLSNVQPTVEQLGGIGDWDLFMSGRLGMLATGIWAFNTFAENCDFAWNIEVEPGGVQKATHFFSNAFVVNAETDKADAANKWITFLASSKEAAALRIAAGWDLPAIKDQSTLNTYLDLTPPDNREAVFESLDHLVVPPVIEEYALMADIITKYLTQASEGKISAKEALELAQSELDDKIKL